MDEKALLLNLLQLVDLSCSRGAWKGSEMKVVGQIREELVEKLKPLMPEEEAEQVEGNKENVE
tara:strand:+ start:963 stop:1151 length:189 start_codon:yes stop_codon:yes gene_type:complete